ncbi:pyocin knob domain-containing protein, partial [Yersinia pseudotuberculosis]
MQKIGDIPNTRADSNGEFTDGNVAAGVPPTILPAEWFNTIQRELMSILSAADIEADSEEFDQISRAILKLVSSGIDANKFLKTDNNLSEIAAAGPNAVLAAITNLNLLTTVNNA